MKRTGLLASCLLALNVAAQQYAGDAFDTGLPDIKGARQEFYRIADTHKGRNHLTLANYYSVGMDGQRIKEDRIQRVIVVLQGLLRDPFNYEKDVLNALKGATGTDPNVNQDSVVVMTPSFLNVVPRKAPNALVWKNSRWSAGGNNYYPSHRHVSSYDVLDDLVNYFNNRTLFPILNQIVMVGHSLGGQMLQRYAALTQVQSVLPVTFWIGNPDSYAWFDTTRPLPTDTCPDYDDYREGYSNFEKYPMQYGVDQVALGRGKLLQNFQSRQIAYARATQDRDDHSTTCAANTTGANRNERFYAFLKAWPPSCPDPSGSNCDTVDLIPVPHDNGWMFGSPAGQARIFHDNFYGNHTRAFDFGYPRKQAGDDPYPDPAHVNDSGVTVTGLWEGNMSYQGCWANVWKNDPSSKLLYNNEQNSIDGCTSGCRGAGFRAAGVGDGTACYCTNSLNGASLVVDDSCYIKCPGNAGQMCGGNERISLFSDGLP